MPFKSALKYFLKKKRVSLPIEVIITSFTAKFQASVQEQQMNYTTYTTKY